MKKVTNTSKDEHHPEWTMGGNPRAIEAQEARGQEELVTADVLPSECSKEDRQKLEQAGVVFGDPVEGDPLFVYATLPQGWEKRTTNHDMWSDLVDENGKKRASIMYKAAFYDRKAMLFAEKESTAKDGEQDN